MSEAVATIDAQLVESLVINGDLAKLTPKERVQYYNHICERLKLDPMTQPFKLLNLNGKQVMYCDRSGAQQLNKIHNVSHQRVTTDKINDVYIVFVRASLPSGRFTESSGAVNIAGKKGDDLANALMKAETKAKRRATLDLLGLGILDETEIETIPNAVKVEPDAKVFKLTDGKPEPAPEDESQLPAEEQAFDPTKEQLTFGKHSGTAWASVPKDYLQWLIEKGKNKDGRTKAQQTLVYLAAHKEDGKKAEAEFMNIFNEPEKDKAVEANQKAVLFQNLYSQIEDIGRKGTLEELEQFVKDNLAAINSTSEKDRAELRKVYQDYKKELTIRKGTE